MADYQLLNDEVEQLVVAQSPRFGGVQQLACLVEQALVILTVADEFLIVDLRQHLLKKAGQLMAAAQAGTLGNDALLNFIIQELVVGHMSQADRRYFPLFRSERNLSVAEVIT